MRRRILEPKRLTTEGTEIAERREGKCCVGESSSHQPPYRSTGQALSRDGRGGETEVGLALGTCRLTAIR